jgi:NADH-quinone oxidoreductase subunit J
MNLESLLLYFFATGALAGGVLMLVARHPMRVALALIGSMLSLAAIYAILGVHVIAVFQVLIYVGAVMVFMVYVIMLLDVHDPSFTHKYGRLLVPGLLFGAGLAVVLGLAATRGVVPAQATVPAVATLGKHGPDTAFLIQPFSAEFLEKYWLHFELTSVLLLAAVVAAIAVIKGGRRQDG